MPGYFASNAFANLSDVVSSSAVQKETLDSLRAASISAAVTGTGAGAAALSGCAKTAPVTSPEEAFSTSRLEYLRPRTASALYRCLCLFNLDPSLPSPQDQRKRPVAAPHRR